MSIGVISRKHQAEIHDVNNEICFDRVVTANEYMLLAVPQYWKHHTYPHHGTKANIVQLLLILSGSIEVNPGPRVKYPCGEYNKAVGTVNSIACDQCQKWYHLKCISMNMNVFNCYTNDNLLDWTCCNCGLLNISNSVFDSCFSDSESSTNSDYEEQPEKNKVQSLRIMIVNFQGIWGKKEVLQKFLYDTNCDVVVGCETHLDPSIQDCEIMPKGFTSYRKDRGDFWGGVILIVKSALISDQVYKSKNTECIAVKIETHRKPVVITVAYRPPKSNLQYLEYLVNDIKTITSKYKASPHWIGGDLNLPDIDWSTNSIAGHQYPKALNESFINMMEDTSMEQLVDFPTRKKNILDILLTNNPSLVSNLKDVPGISDHDRIPLADILCHPRRNRPAKRTIHLWSRADIPDIKNSLNSDIEKLCNEHTENTPVNDLWKLFTTITDSAMSKVPYKQTSTRYNVPWINRECKRLSQRKKRAYRRAKQTNMNSDWERFRVLRKKAKKEYKSAYNSHVNDAIMSDNPKRFYSYIKNKKQDSIGVSTLKVDKNLVIDDVKKADILNKQYCSVFSEPDGRIPEIASPPIDTTMKDFDISTEGITKLLMSIKSFKATGPDGIKAKFLLEFAKELSPALAMIFNASLNQGEVPREWKHAFIVPAYKGNGKSRSDPESYRPISLTSIVCKTMEHILYSKIMAHLTDNDILSEFQHGFREKRSCETQLLLTVDDFANNLNQGGQTDSVLLDFSKAFDKVDHQKLCHKLDHYGIRGRHLIWIQSFLSDRTQQVIVNGKSSPSSVVKSGVPQGTVLGPLLFLIYINDLPSCVQSQVRLFADDAYLYRTIVTQNDTVILQNDLNELQNWEKRWSMEFHPHKCKLLRITNKTKPILNTYTIHGQKLESVDNAKYLGVTLNKHLKWKTHINMVCKKGTQVRNFLQRNLRGCGRATKEQAYKTYVNPILNYASTVWNPIGDGNQALRDQLEMVQRKSARFVFSDWQHRSSPTNMMNQLNWKPLETQRKNRNLIMLHNIVHKNVAIPQSFLPKRSRNIDCIRFQPVHGRINAYKNSFIPASVKLWNDLPTVITNEPVLTYFKAGIENLN